VEGLYRNEEFDMWISRSYEMLSNCIEMFCVKAACSKESCCLFTTFMQSNYVSQLGYR